MLALLTPLTQKKKNTQQTISNKNSIHVTKNKTMKMYEVLEAKSMHS